MGTPQLIRGLAAGALLAVVPCRAGFALAWDAGSTTVSDLSDAAGLEPRWVWWSAREAAPALLDRGVRPSRCWDLGAAGRLLHGLRRDDAAAVWAAEHDLPEPPRPDGGLDLLDLHGESGSARRADGQLSREWLRSCPDPQEWARLALSLQDRQELRARALPDPRPSPTSVPMAVLTCYAESVASLLAVELERTGLPVDVAAAGSLLDAVIGPGRRTRPTSCDVALPGTRWCCSTSRTATSTCAARARCARRSVRSAWTCRTRGPGGWSRTRHRCPPWPPC
jgi:DNA polymerase-1